MCQNEEKIWFGAWELYEEEVGANQNIKTI